MSWFTRPVLSTTAVLVLAVVTLYILLLPAIIPTAEIILELFGL